MNLHSVVAGYVSAVNPMVDGQYQQSTGYSTNADGKRVPSYASAQDVSIQRQPLTSGDLKQMSGINLNGEKAAMYVSGNWDGVSRASQQGGDLITMPDATVWMVVQLLENWYPTAGWVKVATVQQNGS